MLSADTAQSTAGKAQHPSLQIVANAVIIFFYIFKVEATFDMIGYPKWLEVPEKLDKYYENVSCCLAICNAYSAAFIMATN